MIKEEDAKKIQFKETIGGYIVMFNGKNYGTIYKENGRWHTDRELGFATRIEVAKHILNSI